MTHFTAEKEEALKHKIIPQTKQPDFEAFWAAAMDQLRAVPIQVKREKISTPYDKSFTTWELSYNTHDDTWISCYFSCPNNAAGKLPCVVQFHGGSLKKDLYPDILATGVCCLSIDVRGQGGLSYDRAIYKTGSYNGKLMTMGVLDKNEFYMRNIYMDAVRAVDVAATLDEVDPNRIVTFGGSQGGALSITAAALSGRSKKCFNFVTSYSCIHRRIELGTAIFAGTQEFLHTYPHHTDTVMDTVSYFDVNNMVSLLKVPTSFCLCLSDPICLPEFVYSAYAHTDCEKQLHMYPFWQHQVPPDHKRFVYNEFAKL